MSLRLDIIPTERRVTVLTLVTLKAVILGDISIVGHAK
jgi:hypothetical protein